MIGNESKYLGLKKLFQAKPRKTMKVAEPPNWNLQGGSKVGASANQENKKNILFHVEVR
jgi:hypothetical protein